MKTGLWKGKYRVKIYDTTEDGEKKYILEFENGNSITVSTLEEVELD